MPALAALQALCSGLNADQVQLGRGWQIRGGYIHVDRGSARNWPMLPEAARRGVNAVFLAPEGMTPQERQEVFELWQHKTQAAGLQLLPVVLLYGKGDYEHWPLEDRWFVAQDGRNYRQTPCPNGADFWQRKITEPFVEIARWAKTQPNVPGIMFDAEMYGANTSAFPGACFCPSCREEIATELGINVEKMNLDDRRHLTRYEMASAQLAERSLVQTRLQVHAIYPGCVLGGTLLDHCRGDGYTPPFYRAIALAWGTKDDPLLMLSEATYQTGYHAARALPGKPLVRPTGSYVKGKPNSFGLGDHPGYIETWLRRWQQWEAHVDFLGGLWISRIPHENVAENLYHLARRTRGYWVYHLRLFTEGEPLPGEGADAYWQAIGSANEELDRWLKSDGSYISPLKVRPFTLPAPAIDMTRWQKLSLPLTGRGSGKPGLLFRNKGVLFYLPAQAGDDVRLTVVADSAHSTKVKSDALAIVLIDPNGRILRRDKLTAKDWLAGAEQPDGKYVARRQVRFQATQTGVYCLYLKSTRCAFNVGESSHAWLASLRYPEGKHHTRVDRPRELYLMTARGAREAQCQFTAAPSSRPIVVVVSDEAGRQLVRAEMVGSAVLRRRGATEIVIPLEQAAPQMLRVVFETPGARDVNIYPGKGLKLWLGSSADAPFPRH